LDLQKKGKTTQKQNETYHWPRIDDSRRFIIVLAKPTPTNHIPYRMTMQWQKEYKKGQQSYHDIRPIKHDIVVMMKLYMPEKVSNGIESGTDPHYQQSQLDQPDLCRQPQIIFFMLVRRIEKDGIDTLQIGFPPRIHPRINRQEFDKIQVKIEKQMSGIQKGNQAVGNAQFATNRCVASSTVKEMIPFQIPLSYKGVPRSQENMT
jgi:hypothetical protein